jgi:hypothetical protein
MKCLGALSLAAKNENSRAETPGQELVGQDTYPIRDTPKIQIRRLRLTPIRDSIEPLFGKFPSEFREAIAAIKRRKDVFF